MRRLPLAAGQECVVDVRAGRNVRSNHMTAGVALAIDGL
jgi:hypothetical protein